jgi:hypothetical protein
MNSPFTLQPMPTGDAAMRLEQLSASVSNVVWNDITTNNKNGTANNATLYSDFQFNGINNVVTTALEAPLLPATSEWTLQTWITQTSAAAGTIANTRDGNNGWAFRDAPSGSGLDFTPFPFSANHLITPPLDNGDWYHVALTWTPGSPATLKSYVNGVLNTTVTPSDYGAAGIPLAIGSGTAGFYTGKIDTVRVYARNLSADEILRDYYAGRLAHPALVTTANLVSQYLPSGMSTTAWTDVTGSNNMTGAVTSPPAFDGNDYYTIGNPANLQFTNNWSVEAWASQNDTSPAGSFERLISRDNASGSRCFILSQKDNTGVAFAGIFVGGALKSCQTTTDFADNNFHHYMVTHDGTTLKLYVDGALEASVATGGPMDNDSVDWEIGRAQNNSAYLEGRVDTVRFYNATLTAEQITNNYQAGLPAHT